MEYPLSIKEILAKGKPGDSVVVRGWVRTLRDNKSFCFVEVGDGTCVRNIQIVVDNTIGNYAEVTGLTTGSSVTINGDLVASSGKQHVEVKAISVFIHDLAPSDYPLQKKRHSLEYLREIAHLRPRTNAIGAVMRMRSSLSYAIHTFFQERGFFLVHTPIITASDCEGAGEMFRVTTLDAANPPKNDDGTVDFSQDFFGKAAALTVSGQLEGEIAATALSRIYTFGPTFRAEDSNTPRHLAEFWMIEPEAAFFTLAENMDLAEDFVKHCVAHALEKNAEEIDFFVERIDPLVRERLESVVAAPFARVSYTEAIDILAANNAQFQYPVKWGTDIQTEHERYLSETVYKKPVIVYDYPKDIKSFYMKQNDDGRTVKAMDVLVPGIGELIGGSEREDRLDVLTSRIAELGLDEKDYWWYLDLRRFGSVPHAGFGLGFERLLLFVTGMQNIRDVIPFPRFPGNAEF